MPTNRGFFSMQTTYAPDIIDLQDYEAKLLSWKKNKKRLWPPSTIPGLLIGDWSIAEMDAMRQNRREAIDIYNRIRNNHEDRIIAANKLLEKSDG
ncbi:hypothetical protein LCGC14_2826080 [marine sediment metagenome]|uniref:Uncharacterized protein n=1 Tax=marine sediment metagenome TaxID=412755 RepID=A0A0F8Z283_9ZZZZ